MTKSRLALTAWENDRTIVRFPDPAVEVVDERFRSLVVFNSLADSRVRSMRGRIDDRPARLNDRAGSKASGLQAALPHDMEYGLPAGDKIISDYAAVASPPHGFRTHDYAAPFTPLIEQELEAGMKLRRERIVGIVMKALVRPETVDILR